MHCELRLGVVTAVDAATARARARFDDRPDDRGQGMISDWLPVLQRVGTSVAVVPEDAHVHAVGDMNTQKAGGHDHAGTVTGRWLPQVNDQVLVLYEGVFNGRGYILGGVTPWR